MLHRLPRWRRSFLAVLATMGVLLGGACHGQPADAPDGAAYPASATHATTDSSFAWMVERFSEPGGYFDTDNLISNERSYLHVLGALRDHGVSGGAYLGVGPDQNFAYVAQIRPEIAFMVDIRRDNLLEHVFFKSLFALARNRVEFLCLLLGKPLPKAADAFAEHSIHDLVASVDATPTDPDVARAALTAVRAEAEASGLSLSASDLDVIERIHRRFIHAGLDLRFNSHGRAPRAYYPTFRQLLLETDREGRAGSYLAQEDAFQTIKRMQDEHRIVPVVGDLAGDHALRAIGRYLDEHGLTVSALYTSNVEFYLMRQGRFDRFAENVAALPWDARSVIIRSYFNRWTSTHPQTVPGYASTQLVQTFDRFLTTYERGGYASYWDLVNEEGLVKTKGN